MSEEKSIIWAGFDVGKASFVAALDEATASERRKVTSLPCREFTEVVIYNILIVG